MKKYQREALREQFCHCKKCGGILTKTDVAIVNALYPTEPGYCIDCLTESVRNAETFRKYFLRTFLQFLTPAFLIAELLFYFLAGARRGTIFFFSDLLGKGSDVSVCGIILDAAFMILGLAGLIFCIVKLIDGSYFASFVEVNYRDINTVSTSYSLDSNGNINEHSSEGIKRIYDKGDISHNLFAFLFNFFLVLVLTAIGPVLFFVLNILYAIKYCKIRTAVKKFFSVKKTAKKSAIHMDSYTDVSPKRYRKQETRLNKQYAHLTKADRENRMSLELPERHFFLIGENQSYVVEESHLNISPRNLALDNGAVHKLIFAVRENEDGSREYKAFLAAWQDVGHYILYETENSKEISQQTIQQFSPTFTEEYEENALKSLASPERKFRYPWYL